MDDILKYIKDKIEEVLESKNLIAERIILFGSRVKDSETKDSDYDILIVINKDIERSFKYLINAEINKKIVKYLVEKDELGGVDILIKSEKEIDYLKDKIGSVSAEAIKEGTII